MIKANVSLCLKKHVRISMIFLLFKSYLKILHADCFAKGDQRMGYV